MYVARVEADAVVDHPGQFRMTMLLITGAQGAGKEALARKVGSLIEADLLLDVDGSDVRCKCQERGERCVLVRLIDWESPPSGMEGKADLTLNIGTTTLDECARRVLALLESS